MGKIIAAVLFHMVIVGMFLKTIHHYKKTMVELKKSEKKYFAIFQSMLEGFALFQIVRDQYGKPMDYQLLDVNPACESITRLNKIDYIHKSIQDILPQIKKDKISKYHEVALTGVPIKYEEYSKDLRKHLLVNVYRPEEDKIAITLMDITQNKLAEKEILYISYHDKLTDLYNRRFFEEELKRLDTERNLPLGIIMADVNGLKLINDAFGHVMGDNLLIEIAKVLKKACRSDEIIARLGGDEFIILLPKTSAEDVKKIISRIKKNTHDTKLENIELSISLGWDIKNHKDEDIQQILKKSEDYMYKHKLFESACMRDKIIETIINNLYGKEKREEMHSKRVSDICELIGIAMGFDQKQVNDLKNVGVVHDIGKIAINEGILNKTSDLTKEEWNEIKRHSEIGYNILKSVKDMAELAEYVLAHHENWDGTGYPKGTKAEEIPMQARIIKIADAYDAMTSERPYKNKMTKEEAIKELNKNAGIQFDPELISVFTDMILSKT